MYFSKYHRWLNSDPARQTGAFEYCGRIFGAGDIGALAAPNFQSAERGL
jgi:hypothetical protein